MARSDRHGPRETDAILDGQWNALRGRASTPEERLLLAVLEEAYNTVMLPTFTTTRAEIMEARRWFFDEDRDDAFSLVGICEHFGIAPSYIRARIRRLIGNRRDGL